MVEPPTRAARPDGLPENDHVANGLDAFPLSRRQALVLGGLAALAASSLGAGVAPSVPPPGFRFLDSRRLGVRLAVPAEMASRDLGSTLGIAEFEVFEELANRSETDVDDLLTDQLSSIDAMAIDEDGTAVNIMRIASRQVPTAAELLPLIDPLEMSGVEFTEVTTTFGRGTSLRSGTPLKDGTIVVHSHVLWARSAKAVFSVQVTSGDPIIADALYEVIRRTVQPV